VTLKINAVFAVIFKQLVITQINSQKKFSLCFKEEPDTTTTTNRNITAPGTTTPSTTIVTNVDLETFKLDAFNIHNYYRNQPQAGNLERESTLERIAQENSEYMIQTKRFHFTEEKFNDKYIGENLLSSNNMTPDGSKTSYK
jgi:uncharacterized protein YkwD